MINVHLPIKASGDAERISIVTGAMTNEFVSMMGEDFGEVGALRSGLGGALIGVVG